MDGGGRLECRGDNFNFTREGELEKKWVHIERIDDAAHIRTLRALESILPTSCLLRAPAPCRTSLSPLPFFFFLPPPAPGLTVLPSTSALQNLLTAPSACCRPSTESGSASVHVLGDLGRPDTTYREVSGEVGVWVGWGSGARAERVETREVRLEAGMGSMLLR